jgi:methyltransferase-like protein
MTPIIVYIIVFALLMFDTFQHIDAICETLFTKEESHTTEQTTSSLPYDHLDYDCGLY